MKPAALLCATGFGLIAVCYGFARFALGLFLPQMDAELDLPATWSGLIAGGSFLGYCVAILVAARLSERLGARPVAVGAALIAALGMLGIAWAPSASWLGASVLLAGLSAGLASPPMAAAVATSIRPAQQGTVNTIINAGTGAGVALCGTLVLVLDSGWRLMFAMFAAGALMVAVATALVLPAGPQAPAPSRTPVFNQTLKRLIAASFLMGASSTALWSFGAQLVVLRLGWEGEQAGLLWIAIGAAGIAGAGAGTLIANLGLGRTHRIFLGIMAAAIILVGMTATAPAWTLAGGTLFGAAYITLTGVYLVWGVTALPARPATGLTIGFLSMGIGQTAGAPLFGWLLNGPGATCAVLVFAALALAAGLPRADNPPGRLIAASA